MAEELPPGRFLTTPGSIYAAYNQRQRQATAAAASHFFQAVRLAPYHQTLLAEARHRVTMGDHRFAVLLAQTACEFLTEQLVSHLLDIRGVKDLDDWISRRLPSFNMNDAVVKLCEILSKGQITFSADFRARYEKHAARRNGIAHRGQPVTKAEAEQSCDVAAELFRIVEPTLGGRLLLTEPPDASKPKGARRR
jgi:hypothetical protein